jgi:two-component system, sensor histidine kinase and response regulator
MKSLYNNLLNLGVSDKLSELEVKQVKMVNYVTCFAFIIGFAFFIQGLEFDSILLSISRLSISFFVIFVFIFNYYKRYQVARNFLYFILCISTGVFAIIEDVNYFTINFYFGLGMLSFVLYDTFRSKIFGLLFCAILYFIVLFIQLDNPTELTKTQIVNILDAVFLFLSIAFCMNYFIKINKESNETILEKNIELEKININKSKVLSILSHDIRNPINSLIQLLELQKNRVMSSDELNYLLDGLREKFVLQFQSIENLLLWSKNQLSEISLNLEEVDSQQMISDLVSELKYDSSNKEINVRIKFCENDLIIIDRAHLLIILRNLLNNAIKFTDIGGNIRIETSVMPNKYRIDISDDGIGFKGYNSEFKEFNNFTAQKGTNNESGNGIGLILSKELAQKNNGNIFIKSTKSLGTTIRLEFIQQNK